MVVSTYDQVYRDVVEMVYRHGRSKDDRTNTGTVSLPGQSASMMLLGRLPLIGLKFTSFRIVLRELQWFLSGDTNTQFLQDHNVRIWDEWATEAGDLGPIYGQQWRSWPTPTGETIDQIQQLVEGLRHNPDSRRHIVSAWNPADLPDESMSPQENVAEGRMALAPCHLLFQCHSVPLTIDERIMEACRWDREFWEPLLDEDSDDPEVEEQLDLAGFAKRGLMLQMYQRS